MEAIKLNVKPLKSIRRNKIGLSMEVNCLSIVIILIGISSHLVSEVEGSSFNEFKSIPWGGSCKIPSLTEPLLPEEECDQSKGISCQTFSQGDFCGCKINSHLSYDRRIGECRKMPYQHCLYINKTLEPEKYEEFRQSNKYQWKCHSNAVCTPDFTQESEAQQAKAAKCLCSYGHIVSRDHRECENVNSSHRTSVIPFQLLSLSILLTAFTSKLLFL